MTSSPRHRAVHMTQDIDRSVARLRQTASLPVLLAASFDAFEVIRQLARQCENDVPDLLAAFMSAAAAAADGRDAITTAPALLSASSPARHGGDPVRPPDPQAAADSITMLAAVLATRLDDAASQATTPRDQLACRTPRTRPGRSTSSWQPLMTPTLGDFLDQAAQRLAAITLPDGDLPARARRELIGELGRLLTVMARYARDQVDPSTLDPAAPPARSGEEQPAPSVPIALTCAAERLTLAARSVAETGASASHPAASHPVAAGLRSAADALAAGHDVLQTHVRPPGVMPPAASSPWAPVVSSQAATSALLGELAGYARQLAPLAASLATPAHAGIPAQAAQALRAASGWLHLAGSASAGSQPAERQFARQLLTAIPANIPPARQVPAPDGI